MHTKVFTINGNFYEAEGGIDDILRKFKLNGTTGLYIYGLAMRNLQTVPHRVIIPFSAIESIEDIGDDKRTQNTK